MNSQNTQFDFARWAALRLAPVAQPRGSGVWRLAERFALAAALFGWALAVAGGCIVLARYSGTANARPPASQAWPDDSSLSRDRNWSTLVIFIHPRCPCSSATLRELERLISECDSQLRTSVVFVEPPGTTDDWAATDLYRSALAITGVRVVLDRGAFETTRFGARTSGEALLYDAHGRLLFQGGITPARGHEGDSDGRAAIAEWVGGRGTIRSSPVFGCSLLGASRIEQSR
jgi:hypothetical protein